MTEDMKTKQLYRRSLGFSYIKTDYRFILHYEEGERDVYTDDLDQFKEVGECGTAAVIALIGGLQVGEDFHVFYSEDEVGPVTQKLYDELVGIQFGDREAPEGWTVTVDE